jgi:hypothetical protein
MPKQVETWPGREVTKTTFSDITPKAVAAIEWDHENNMIVTFAEELTTEELRLIRRRMRASSEREPLEQMADQAIAAINAFNSRPNATNAQVADQVRLLGRVVKGLIKLNVPDAPNDPSPNT